MAAGIAVDSKWQAKEVKEERVRGREREKKAKGTKKRVNGGMWRPRFVQTFSDKIPDFFQTKKESQI